MNYLDIIISVCLLYAIIKGFSNGLIKEITSLVSLFLGVYVGVNFAEYLVPKVVEVFSINEGIGVILAFSTLFLVTLISVRLLGRLMDKLTKFLALGLISSLLGAIFGLFKVVVVFSAVFYFTHDNEIISNKAKKESVLFEPLISAGNFILPQIQKHNLLLENIDKKSGLVKEKLNTKINSQ